MSLDYDVRDVIESAKADGNEWMTTQSMIFATMTVGINNIKDRQTAELFHTRWVAASRVLGHPMTRVADGGSLERYTPSLAEVVARIGLKTNASPMTPARFGKRLVESLMDDAANVTRRQAAELPDAPVVHVDDDFLVQDVTAA